MLSAFHQSLVDDLAGIILASLDMNSFFYDCVSTLAECSTSFVLTGNCLRGGHGEEGETVGMRVRLDDDELE